MIERISRNIHKVAVDKSQLFLLLSDLHWDNPKCERDLLKRHLKQARERGAAIVINGDFFCLMMGKYDPRRSKKDILPEHNKANYIDAVVEDAVKWWTPYADMILLIGYGNHECYHPDTKVLTDKGWVNITEVTTEDMVATFDNEYIYFEKPNAVVSKPADKLYTIEGSYTKQVVSSKHAVMLNDMTKINAEDFATWAAHERVTEMALPHGRKVQPNSAVDAKWVEILTAVVMDATIVDHAKYEPASKKIRVQFKLSKPEKIAYVRSILDAYGVDYTFAECKMTGVNKLQPYYIRIYGDWARKINQDLNGIKQLPEAFAALTGEGFDALVQTIQKTDGSMDGNLTVWSSTDSVNIDIVQRACILNGWLFKVKVNKRRSGFANGKPQYLASFMPALHKAQKINVSEQDYDGLVHCLNMPSGCFVTQIDGKVAFSGNTAIIKNLETDPLQRFVDLLNMTCGTNVQVGGYGGVLHYQIETSSNTYTSAIMKYYHGFGGGGAVTKGVIQDQRMMAQLDGYDIIWMGHVHEMYHHVNMVDCYEPMFKRIVHKEVHQLRTAAYKEEYEDGFGGYHIEKGRPVKPLGGYWMHLGGTRRRENGRRTLKAEISFTKTD